MAITYTGLLEADFSKLENAGETWISLGGGLESSAGELEDLKRSDGSKLGADNWFGDTPDWGRERLRDIVLAIDDRAAAARRVGIAITDAAAAFKSCQSDLSDVIAEIDRERAHLTDTGSVIPDTSRGTDNVTYAETIASRIRTILETAEETDETLKAAVGMFAETMTADERRNLAAQAEGPAAELQELIDAGSSPEKVNDWWESLDEQERLALLEANPELIGPVDGIPTDFRDTANRELLDRELGRFDPVLDSEIADLQARLDEMEASGDRYSGISDLGVPYTSDEYSALAAQLGALQEERDRRDALTGLQDAITGQADTGQEHFLLGYDSAGDGKAIVSVGNPDTADNTAVYVPGTTSDLGNFPGSIDRAETMASDARFYDPNRETAVVAWLDYDAPDDVVPDAGDHSYAKDAGPVLSQFSYALEATHHGSDSAHTTIVGHSYGTTVVGHTASEYGVEADKIIAVASPGLDTVSAGDLGVGAENVYVTTAEGDDIRYTTDTFSDIKNTATAGGALGEFAPADAQGDGSYAWHGPTNPLHDDYGANVFASNATDAAGNSTNDGGDIHGGYWAEGNIARENIAYIISDQTDRVTSAEEYVQ
ncbi:alpha/beta hydrolase family protein [Glycomyces sp. L485]|uniref:alpha/beta hydrolase n=1 Tax=Glycomyces sp. L485 TaxID=2909235 RepID=UPI001F4B42EF|nr:alpha/beta hydrolase [Glycomyces sp. L485]MCH7232972.1 alpha/beta hydrolase family protein [Glycomyces sp. L485]